MSIYIKVKFCNIQRKKFGWRDQVDHKRLVKVCFACLILCLMGSCLVEIAGATQDSETWYTKELDLYFDHKYVEAIKAFDKAIEIDPQSSTLWDAKGLALDKLNKHDEAIKSYDKAIEINPRHSNAWSNKKSALSSKETLSQILYPPLLFKLLIPILLVKLHGIKTYCLKYITTLLVN